MRPTNTSMTFGYGLMPTDPAAIAIYKKLGLKGHNGDDYGTGKPVPTFAIINGTVVTAGEVNDGGGKSVRIRSTWTDGREYICQHDHLSRVDVRVGQKVQAGQQVGMTGSTGASTGVHLHFSIRPVSGYNAQDGYYGYINPAPFYIDQGGHEDMTFEQYTRILASVAQNNPDYPQAAVDHWVNAFNNGFDPEEAMRQFLNDGNEFLSQHRSLKEYQQARENAGNPGYPGGTDQFATDRLAGGDTHESVLNIDMAFYVPLEGALSQADETNDELQEEIDQNEVIIKELHEALDSCLKGAETCDCKPCEPSDPSTPTPPDSEPATPPVATQGLLERLIDAITKWLNRN